jgi:DNA-binding transcriptional LysR family regulator
VPPSGSYAPPHLLLDLHILDLLELAGSQARAGAALAMHQSTVSRSVQSLREQLKLQSRQGPAVCRHGHNDCLGHLRLAYRAHRLMEGVLRLGSDALHHSLISRLTNVQHVPPRFRSAEQWAQLIRHGLLDGALLSSFGLDQRLLSGQAPRWDGLTAKPLGTVAMQLVATSPTAKRVLLPNKATTPLLHQTLDWHGLKIETQPSACQEPAAWLKRARDRGAALPICPALVGEPWLAANGLVALQEQPPLVEQLWLLLPQRTANNNAARQLLRQLRSQISAIQTMQDPHGSQA